MSDIWKPAKASEITIGDTVRTQKGDIVLVSHIEPSFLNRPGMMALIEDTAERWYKRPLADDADVEILAKTES